MSDGEERWAWVGDFHARASSLGRVTGARDQLLKPYDLSAPRVNIYPWVTVGKRKSGAPKFHSASVAGCVACAFGLADTPFVFVRHIDGDRTNCRLENLSVPARTPKGYISEAAPKRVSPWTPVDDRKLRDAKTLNAALQTSRHSKGRTLARLEHLGIRLSGWRVVTPLMDRSLDTLNECIAALEQAGLPDRQINLAINIEGVVRRGIPEVQAAMIACITELHRQGWPRHRIGAAFGLDQRTITRWMARAGIADVWAAPSKAGLPEELPGEIWRQCGWGYQVSNFGRVIGSRGGLITPCQRDRAPSVTMARGNGHRTTAMVAALVLAAFRPDLTFSARKHVYRNGDQNDVRLSNLIPAPTAKAQANMMTAAKRAVPAWVDEPAVRSDLGQDCLLIMLEGVTTDAAVAMRLAIKRYNDLTGNDLSMFGRKGRSLDAEISGTDGLTLGDTISSDMDRL